MSLFQHLVPTFGRSAEPASRSAASTSTSAAPAPAGLAPTLRPVYSIRETPASFDVTVDLPGVAKDGLEITSEEGLLSIVGRRVWRQPTGWTRLHRESVDADYALTLRHDDAVDAERIQAELRDGVLRLTLPKGEALKPRRIPVGGA
jgi:HSP20 family molecular chaperone IbpA